MLLKDREELRMTKNESPCYPKKQRALETAREWDRATEASRRFMVTRPLLSAKEIQPRPPEYFEEMRKAFDAEEQARQKYMQAMRDWYECEQESGPLDPCTEHAEILRRAIRDWVNASESTLAFRVKVPPGPDDDFEVFPPGYFQEMEEAYDQERKARERYIRGNNALFDCKNRYGLID